MNEDVSPTGPTHTWTPLSRRERLIILAAVAFIAAITIPRLPPGVCYGDSGDLQLASATLGIAHPPGYSLLISMGWLASRVPGVEPAYAVTLLCLACGVGAITLSMLLMIRLGASPAIAATLGVLATAHPRVWSNLLAPEVYAPGLFLLAAAAYFVIGYAYHGRKRNIAWAGLLFGAAVATRPPVVMALPFILAAIWFADRGFARPVSRRIRTMALGAVLAAAPLLYQAGYYWLRDAPDAPYNYIEQFNAEANVLPPADQGPASKLQRLIWLVRGSQFQDMMGYQRAWFKRQLAAIDGEATLEWLDLRLPTVSGMRRAAVWAVLLLGLVVLARKSLPALLVLLGVALQSVVFVSLYRVTGAASDMLPLLWTALTLAGIAFAPLLGRSSPARRTWIALTLLAVSSVWTLFDASSRDNIARSLDATRYLAKVGLATFPENAVICSSWDTALPLWYAQKVTHHRSDIRIINAESNNWLRLIEPYPDRPIFFTVSQVPLPPDASLIPFRPMWRLEREKL